MDQCKEHCKEHSGVDKAIENLEQGDIDQWNHINAIEAALPKLVPVWVTIVLTCMGALTGAALTFAGMMVKFAGGDN